jgi:uncharacterized membrane protein
MWLWLLVPGLALVVAWAWRSDVQLSRWRRRASLGVRGLILVAIVLALAGLQTRSPRDGMTVYYLLDRSESVPASYQQAALDFVNRTAALKRGVDRAGVVVFARGASIETSANALVDVQKIQAVLPAVATDIASAIRLGTAAFPETGQRRLVLLSDGNENVGDAHAALAAARSLGVTLDVVPLGAARGEDVALQRLALPGTVKQGQPFELRIFALSDGSKRGALRLYRNEQLLGEQTVELSAGKNLFTLTQELAAPGFYHYEARLDAPGDVVPQNNRTSGFAHVRGDPRVLLLSSAPQLDHALIEALRQSRIDVTLRAAGQFPETLAELQSYDSVLLSNVAAGDVPADQWRLLESAVRDFGVGVVCIGGDQAFGAGGYRGTPLESLLPVDMELDSQRLLPRGALVLVMHGMEFNNGNQIARDIAVGTLDALGAQDELGIVLWDGSERWLFELQPVGDKKALGRQIQSMNQGDLPTFQGVLTKALEALGKSSASMKHIIVFSDGDPAAPTPELMEEIVSQRITVSTVLIAGHFGPQTMIAMADQGRGRFYDVRSPDALPQIFIKEAAVVLKSAIYEDPFTPRQAAASEVVQGFGSYPILRGYVATTPKARAEVPLVSDKGDPVLAHWQFGLGRAVAFTSDARAKWAQDWLGWPQFRQFWTQLAQWSLRRIDTADFAAEMHIEEAAGTVVVEATDAGGGYRNFVQLQTVVLDAKGERQVVPMRQVGPGRYEGRFQAAEVGAYVAQIAELHEDRVRASRVVGATVSYSPEFSAHEPNRAFLSRLTQAGGGRLMDFADPGGSPFLHGRERTYQPIELWEWLLQFAILAFPLDVGLRRVHLDWDEWAGFLARVRRRLRLGGAPSALPATARDAALAQLLTRKAELAGTASGGGGRPQASELEPPRGPEPSRPGLQPPSVARVQPLTSAAASAPPSGAAPRPAGEPTATASKVLEARRRARPGQGPGTAPTNPV